jgi:UDP-N-acetylglucosamine 3-dehydrogenase
MSRKTAALVGCGNMSTVVHLPILAAMPDLQIVAVCDVLRERAEHAAAIAGGAAIYDDVVTLARDVRADALIVVVAPQNLLAVLEAALPVAREALFVEKPLGFDEREARRIGALAGDELLTFCGFNRRYWPAFSALRTALAGHRLAHVGATFFKHIGDREHWWTPAQPLIFSEMCHALDLALELGGPAGEATFRSGAQRDPDVIDLLAGLGTFASGATWTATCNFSSGNQKSTLTAHAPGLRLEIPDSCRLVVSCDNAEDRIYELGGDLPWTWRDGYGFQWREFRRLLDLAHEEQPHGFAREIATMELCARALEGNRPTVLA